MTDYSLRVFDTSDFSTFPVGGQLTSVRNFLRFFVEKRPELVPGTLLVGMTTVPSEVGVVRELDIHGARFAFLAVAYYPNEFASNSGSMRLRYLRGLIGAITTRRLSLKGGTNFFHTPEPILVAPTKYRTRNVLFSHGSLFNMRRNFRFFQNTPLPWAYEQFATWAIKRVDTVFVLDRDSERQYAGLNDQVVRVSNSVVVEARQPDRVFSSQEVKLLYAGRLSAGKRIDRVIEAAEASPLVSELRVIGEGEDGTRLRSLRSTKSRFLGAIPPDEVPIHMRDCDILVLNSSHEGMPMVILEALATGLPVIATPVGAIPDVVRFGSNAEKSDGSAESIIRAIEIIVNGYSDYASSALNAGRYFDYRTVNAVVLDHLFPSWT